MSSSSSSTYCVESPTFLDSPNVSTEWLATARDTRDEYEIARARYLSNLGNFIALGVVRVFQKRNADGSKKRYMINYNGISEVYPSKSMILSAEKDWVKFVRVENPAHEGRSAIRVYGLPEDADRTYRRGSVGEFRRAMKHLMGYIDRSSSGWVGDFGPSTPFESYLIGNKADESLFYIFNTLISPTPKPDLIFEPNARKAAIDSLSGEITGLRTILYPYQTRSVAAMLQKESAPLRMADPRMLPYLSLCNRHFYYDREEGRLLEDPDMYEDERGGVLAETMGYGKTLICLALILATRGHFPQIPEGRLAIEQPARHRTGTLLEMAAAGAGRYGRPWKAHFHSLTRQGYYYEHCTARLQESVGRYAEPLFVPRSGNRVKDRPTEKIIKLCATTLVVVPPNLLGQWLREINSHTECNALDILTLDHNVKDIPNEDILRKHDVVIITKPRFEQEYRDNDLHTGKRGKGKERFKSPLSELRWLRVIVDEGHNFASSAQRTNAMAMLDNMHIERRWVVSGTPSNALIGVEVGMAAEENKKISESLGHKAKRVLDGRQMIDSYEEERKNIEKLRLIIMNFLRLRPWSNSRGDDHAAWNRYMSNDRTGQGLQKSADLRSVLQNLIVRHRIEDIEVDLKLPPLLNKVVYLEPSFHDKLSMNLFLATLASNAVTSERTDQDYMFHRKNRKSLEVLISNLRQSSFHWVGMNEHDITETTRISKAYLKNSKQTISNSDETLLLDAILIGETALNSPAWRAFSKLHEMGVFIHDFPEFASESWSLTGHTSIPLLLGTVQARAAQLFVDDRIGQEEPTAGLAGAGIKAMSTARKRAAEETEKAANDNKDVANEPKLKDQTTAPRIRANSLTSSARQSLRTQLDSASPLRESLIVGFSSSKLAYLVSELLKVSPTEKSIIFYSHPNVAFWIAEALELLAIRFLIYSNTLTVARRATYLATFNQKDEFRVLLMDLKQAAHGLHVAAASRVYIVEPVWQPGIESQAIKRAHRIGQTRPVYVETLVLRDTLEDRMLRRRKQMSNVELQKAEKSLLDDVTMNEIIKNEKFLKFTSEESSSAGQVAFIETPQQFFGRSKTGPRDSDDPDGDLVFDPADLARRKKKLKETPTQLSVSADGEPINAAPRSRKKQKGSSRIAVSTDSFPAATEFEPFLATATTPSNTVQSNLSPKAMAEPPEDQVTSAPVISIFGGPSLA